MGGLASGIGGRYIGPRGTTTGDVTGGGGRSVMPNRDFLNMLAARRRRQMARSEMIGGGGGGAARYEGDRSPLVPPGGWQAGGEVTWQNATPQQWAALNKPAWAPATGGWSRQARRNQHLAARGLPPSQWSRYIAPHLRDPRSLPHPGNTYGGQPVLKSNPYATSTKPPGGGYSGGVIPRFQSGRTVNPRAAGAAARRRNAPPQERRYPPRMDWTQMLDDYRDYRSSLPVPPGGWQAGGAVGYSHGGVFPRHGSVTEDPTNPGSYSIWKRGRTIGDLMGGGGRSIMPTRRRGNYNFNRSELYPNWSATGTGQVPTVPTPMLATPPGGGYSGGVVPSFQTGGQLEEPLFPVESELADESPWYPDEEVGYGEAAPMQGGFDIFGRSGG